MNIVLKVIFAGLMLKIASKSFKKHSIWGAFFVSSPLNKFDILKKSLKIIQDWSRYFSYTISDDFINHPYIDSPIQTISP